MAFQSNSSVLHKMNRFMPQDIKQRSAEWMQRQAHNLMFRGFCTSRRRVSLLGAAKAQFTQYRVHSSVYSLEIILVTQGYGRRLKFPTWKLLIESSKNVASPSRNGNFLTMYLIYYALAGKSTRCKVPIATHTAVFEKK